MAEINKHLEKGQRLLQKGKLEAGLEELLIARKEEPGNDDIVLMVADVYQHLNRMKDYRQCFGYLFDKYAERGISAKAFEYLETLEKLGLLEPKRQIACAQLLEKQKPTEAADYYRRALEALGGQDPETALQCLQGLAALQPASLEIHQRIAEVATKTGNTSLAASARNKMGELLLAAKKYPEAVEALEEASRLSGQNASAKLTLAKACSLAGRYVRVLEVLGKEGEESDDPQVQALIAEAYFAEKQLPQAEAAYWKLLKSSSQAIHPLMDIGIEYLRQKNFSVGFPLVKKAEQHLSAAKDHKGLISLAEKLGKIDNDNVAVLEFLARLADQLHLDNPLGKSLSALFDLYFAAGEFHKATDALERLIDVDPYDPESFKRLQRLEGKADPSVWKTIAARLGKTSTVEKAPPVLADTAASEATSQDSAGEAGGGNVLGDLILQAEIFLQYKLEDKAKERLQRIAKLYPGEEDRNEELRNLYERARFTPQAGASVTHSTPGRTGETLTDFNRISEIIRSLSRQSTVKSVLSAVVNDIGRLWLASRCVVGLAVPKRPPSMVLEYLSPGVSPSDAALLGKLVMGLQQITEEQSSAIIAEKIAEVPRLEPLKASLAAMKVQSLVAIPLRDSGQPVGILVLEQCGLERRWRSNDVPALETLAEQIVFALSNARLRSLMKTLAVADEHSGLLHRESYLTCLLSTVEGMQAQKKPLSAAILQFSVPQRASRGREEELEEFMRQFGSTFVAHLRQSDIPLKYGPYSLAAIMPGTVGKEAVLMAEKMRKLSAAFSDAEGPPPMAAGVAEAVQGSGMDSTDIVTELINRVECALEEAQASGGNMTKILPPPSLPQ